jgi:hypothetical protein
VPPSLCFGSDFASDDLSVYNERVISLMNVGDHKGALNALLQNHSHYNYYKGPFA